ncbi:DUF6633 family protein [Bacteroides pyogenes]|uniref:DUF6633 family protein n=2 Tax=Bacteroides pyogenes TaxID=310300 RepID=UPI002010F3F0|nr:DUF6633 family protein [Bacteroides pyogenes]MBR8725433.1 hypothetical protein [Bacteroides pyogenes]MBR8740051.1 hypothetical protein [Bacteroides pyogenes]MBR8796019.1 hypothetical protein [Bacteroides pyogenes]
MRYGELNARAAVAYLLADALEFFNAGETMSDTQVAMTVDLIIEEYPHLKTDDLKLCFKNAMKLKYGQIYNRIDGQVVLSWLKKYNSERCSIADKQSYKEHRLLIESDSKPTSGLFYEEYRAELQERARNGDKDAVTALELSDRISNMIQERRVERQKKDLNAFYKKLESENETDNQMEQESHTRHHGADKEEV